MRDKAKRRCRKGEMQRFLKGFPLSLLAPDPESLETYHLNPADECP
jgi:hypothetical protein